MTCASVSEHRLEAGEAPAHLTGSIQCTVSVFELRVLCARSVTRSQVGEHLAPALSKRQIRAGHQLPALPLDFQLLGMMPTYPPPLLPSRPRHLPPSILVLNDEEPSC